MLNPKTPRQAHIQKVLVKAMIRDGLRPPPTVVAAVYSRVVREALEKGQLDSEVLRDPRLIPLAINYTASHDFDKAFIKAVEALLILQRVERERRAKAAAERETQSPALPEPAPAPRSRRTPPCRPAQVRREHPADRGATRPTTDSTCRCASEVDRRPPGFAT